MGGGLECFCFAVGPRVPRNDACLTRWNSGGMEVRGSCATVGLVDNASFHNQASGDNYISLSCFFTARRVNRGLIRTGYEIRSFTCIIIAAFVLYNNIPQTLILLAKLGRGPDR